MTSSVPQSHCRISGASESCSVHRSCRCRGPWKSPWSSEECAGWLCSVLNLGHWTMNIPQMVVVVMVVRVMKSAEKQHLPLGFASGGFLTARSLKFLHPIPRWVSALRSQNLCKQPLTRQAWLALISTGIYPFPESNTFKTSQVLYRGTKWGPSLPLGSC